MSKDGADRVEARGRVTFETRQVIDTLDIEIGASDEVVPSCGQDHELLDVDVEYADRRSQSAVATEFLSAEFPAERDSPRRARRLVAAALWERGCDQALVDDVALVLTELASNAVLHTRLSFSISAQERDSMLRVAVRDGIPLDATKPNGGLIQRPAHGLDLIDAISTRWGVERAPGGKVVWAELPYEMRCQPGGSSCVCQGVPPLA
jgi:hypothetical protein